MKWVQVGEYQVNMDHVVVVMVTEEGDAYIHFDNLYLTIKVSRDHLPEVYLDIAGLAARIRKGEFND